MSIFQKKSERGFVLVTMGVVAIALIGALGLAVDMGRTFITKNETQTFADAAALAAALQLNGAATGITNANAAVTGLQSKNKWNFATSTISSPTVEFNTSPAGATASNACDGTWTATPPSPPTNYNCVRVRVSAPLPMYFLPVVMPTPAYTTTVQSQSIAAQLDVTTIGTGLAPYSGIGQSTVGPNFGLTVGNEYFVQWPSLSAGGGCSQGNPDNCFNGGGSWGRHNNNHLCTGETPASKWSVAGNWSASTSGYWGATSNSLLESYILGGAQLASLSTGTNIQPLLTSGQKNAEAAWLDWKVNNDIDSTDASTNGNLSWAAYQTALDTGHANGQRLISVPILQPISTTNTTVLGYGQYLLESSASSNMPGNSDLYVGLNGNDGWCAIYMGPMTLGSATGGVGGFSGASQVQLIQ